MRTLFLVGMTLAPFIALAQETEQQFVLAVPDGGGFLSPGRDGILQILPSPRGTFLVRNAENKPFDGLPSAQQVHLLSKGGDIVREVLELEDGRLGLTEEAAGKMYSLALLTGREGA